MDGAHGIETLGALLRLRSADTPNEPAYHFLSNSDGPDAISTITYDELVRRSLQLAALISRHVAVGERVVLLCPPGLDYVTAFFGCMLADVVAVPAFPPDPARFERTSQRLRGILADCRPGAIVAARDLRAFIESQPEGEALAPDVPWLVLDHDVSDSVPSYRDERGPDAPAFLQYTSGSTGNPRGVVLSHRNLLANLSFINTTFRHTKESRGVIWLPPYHDMGLIGGVLAPLSVGFPVLLMSPLVMLKSPYRWLRAISEFRGTISGGPNFAYELAVRRTSPEQRAKLDLSSWRIAFCGAEPIQAETLLRFTRAFEPSGFDPQALLPCYGLAEGTLMVTGEPQATGLRRLRVDRATLARGRVQPAEQESSTACAELVSCGRPVGDWRLAIVDPETGMRVSSDCIGEIWARGACVASGYWGLEELTQDTFRGRIADEPNHAYLRTGDLGFFHEGALYVVGRSKDVIIVRGRNLYPHDLELTAQAAHASVRRGCAAAFGVTEGGEERVALVLEVVKNADFSAIEQAVRVAVADEHAVRVHALVLIEPSSLPKTSSGKVARSACRDMYNRGSLRVLSEWRDALPAPDGVAVPAPVGPMRITRDELLAWLRQRIATAVGKAETDLTSQHSLLDQGLDSLQIVQLFDDLGEVVGRPLSPTLALEHPQLEPLVDEILAGERSARPAAPRGRSDRPMEPIAIVGMAGRFPGAEDTRELWSLLRKGDCAVGPASESRTRHCHLHAHAGYLSAVDMFDAGFFGLSRREAVRTDPQQRLLMEVAWEALEDAGIDPDTIRGSSTGVFVGISNAEYASQTTAQQADLFLLSGRALSMAANRLSYVLDLRGPSVAVDSACSSSLVAVHLACQSLITGDSDLTLAGGVNLLLSDWTTAALAHAKMLAKDARCKTFDARADGYVRGEGCGIVALRRLDDARKAGDRVLAVIRASVATHGGHAPGLTVPRVSTQRDMLQRALARADIEGSRVSFVESHGTGTVLGDSVELQALGSAFAADQQQTCWVSSVKANIGHLESAAGIGGMIKALLCLRHRQIPKQIHFENPTPTFSFSASRFKVPTQTSDWESERRIAVVNSFGFGGANAHVVLEEAASAVPVSQPPDAWEVFLLSARTEAALQEQSRRMAKHLETGHVALAEACFTAATGRKHFQQRRAFAIQDAAELVHQLRAHASGDVSSQQAVASGRSRRPAIDMLLGMTGQPPMWRPIAERHPEFARALADVRSALCNRLATVPVDWPFMALRPGDSRPECVAFAFALAHLLGTWHIDPNTVAGDGEWHALACCLAGLCSIDEVLMSIIEGRDAVIEVAASEDRRWPQLTSLASRASKPRSVLPIALVVDGVPAERAAADSACVERGIARLVVQLYMMGVDVNWRRYYAGRALSKCELPTYAFERESYWIENGPGDPAPKDASAPAPRPATTDRPVNGHALAAHQPAPDDSLALVMREAALVLELEVSDLNADTPLAELGMDSLLAIELQDRLEHLVGVRIALETFAELTTLTDIDRALRDHLSNVSEVGARTE